MHSMTALFTLGFVSVLTCSNSLQIILHEMPTSAEVNKERVFLFLVVACGMSLNYKKEINK